MFSVSAYVQYDCWDDALLVEDHVNVGSLLHVFSSFCEP